MSSQAGHSISPAPGPASTGNSGVRRHHTISASSRNARPTSKIQGSELEDAEQEEIWDQDEYVAQDWRGGIGAVGEKSSLHRQASLPTKYHRAFGGPGQRQPGNSTPRTLNSLTAIAGHEGDEEEWEEDLRGLRHEDEGLSSSDHGHQGIDSASASPLSPHFAGGIPNDPSPPPANGGSAAVRRHHSLNYPNAAAVRRGVNNTGLKRAGTLQAPPIKGHPQQGGYSGGPQSPSPTNAEEEYEYDDDSVRAEEDHGYFRPPTQQGQGQYPTSPIGRSSPWSTPGAGNDWRTQIGGNGNPNMGIGSGAIDDVSRALSALEINQQYGGNNAGSYQQGQSAHPPRFNPPHPPPLQTPGLRNGPNANFGGSRKLQLVTDFDPQAQQGSIQSASAYVPPIGHGLQQNLPQRQNDDQQPIQRNRDRANTASGNNPWDQKEHLLGGRMSNPNLNHLYQGQQGKNGNAGIPNVPPIPSQYLNSQGQAPRMGVTQSSGNSGGQLSQGGRGSMQGSSQGGPEGVVTSPIDVPTLIATKGYNPSEFDTRPLFARYFVIKSYTEDDVHKSLKYEIWSSTDPGNKRLDKAFKETAGRGPIYLFFSVNARYEFMILNILR
ncbi:hypothetical protein PHLCEN_2v7832 [Hermanssonia centrifuga]|uniref:YTH domain-containing protein n=1 Tax=Hermanssonia centrifuga TaxID=98765 RepID=A0A2R6NVN1_9APHY|nr:hypothetical protein PHLCEN_2v7832 [Hermanssonia centrifuga]